MVRIAIFEGNSLIEADKDVVRIDEWSAKCVTALLCDRYDDWENNEPIEDMFEHPTTIHATLEEVVQGRVFQGVLEAIDGGMIYIIKLD